MSYLGVLQQALRDLSQWVEKGIAPPPSTSYVVEDGQVIVPATARERKGIQPVANLTIKKDKKAVIQKAGKKATFSFSVVIDVPENTGKIVHVEWDFENKGTFTPSKFKTVKDGKITIATAKHKFRKKGVYFPIVKVMSQRNGDDSTPYTLIQNLDRVRVIVK